MPYRQENVMTVKKTVLETNDPWAQRTTLMQCQTCIYYVPKLSADSKHRIGRCRKSAPTHEGYPAVFPIDWCGKHKLDENKYGN